MQWSNEANGMLSDEGYFITRTPMASGWWHNAYSPKNRGTPIASGQLERCLQVCERHAAGDIYARTKRALRAGSVRPRRRNSSPVAAHA